MFVSPFLLSLLNASPAPHAPFSRSLTLGAHLLSTTIDVSSRPSTSTSISSLYLRLSTIFNACYGARVSAGKYNASLVGVDSRYWISQTFSEMFDPPQRMSTSDIINVRICTVTVTP